MHDIRAIRADFPAYKALMDKRGKDFGLEKFTEMDERRRALLHRTEEMKAKQNAASKEIPAMKKEGKDTTALMAQMKALAEEIKALEPELRAIDEELEGFLMGIPNVPHPDVPQGASDADNVEVRKWGTPPQFDFSPKPHWDLGEELGILDMAAAAKITGSRFSLLRGMGARLERALINFMLERHTAHGYVEVSTPLIVNRRSATGTGQLPKFEEEMMFKLEKTEYFLNPTAEVPVTNIHQDEILDGTRLPIQYCAFAPSFRKEGGSAGRDTRGLIRMHQFPKVEIVRFTRPEDSYAALEALTADAEDILQKLNLPYRVVNRCTADLGFCAAKGYDLEVWMPSYARYVEISSCSNFEAFQARRAGIRFKDAGGKPQFVHTLNGSGLAVNRTLAAILENFQQADGSIRLPEVLEPFMQGLAVIK
ncbi:MAG: serine--tRNA ligase [Defluviitaleaceae bacterium]|nr:serine--tRNA ligase [Defluviitaleaceae bacterium]MCL2238704.1 serine--tRNA ligase [Defluviitaleaceae bacterium]